MKKAKTSKKRPPISALLGQINQLQPRERIILAQKCGTSFGNLRQIAYGWGGVSPRLAKRIIQNCEGVTLGELIPELYQ